MSIERQSFGDHFLVPERAILIVEQHQFAGGVEPRRGAGMLQQEKRRQAHDLRLTLEQPQQQPSQAYRFLAQGAANLGRIAAGGIPLVENQVDHRSDGGQPFRAFHRARRLERHAGARNPRLGAGDTLFHRSLRDQKGARDLPDRQAGDDAERKRDLLRRRQVRMAADEQ